jgi:ribonuclease HI
VAAKLPNHSKFLSGPFIHAAFDGGCTPESVGTCGYVIAISTTGEVVRRGIYLGKGYTCTTSEATGLKLLVAKLRELVASGELPDYPIRLLGDSQLLIRHLLGINKKTSIPLLYEVV